MEGAESHDVMLMERTTVLVADPDHGPRAQLAAAVLRAADEDRALEVSSAGTEPGGDLTAIAEVLAERGVGFKPQSVRLHLSMAPDLLIVVCEEGCAACPYLPRAGRIVRWPFEDPTQVPAEHRADALREIAARLQELAAGLLEARPGSA